MLEVSLFGCGILKLPWLLYDRLLFQHWSISSFGGELVAALLALQLAFHQGWSRLWLEMDFFLVVRMFHTSRASIPPWNICSLWSEVQTFRHHM